MVCGGGGVARPWRRCQRGQRERGRRPWKVRARTPVFFFCGVAFLRVHRTHHSPVSLCTRPLKQCAPLAQPVRPPAGLQPRSSAAWRQRRGQAWWRAVPATRQRGTRRSTLPRLGAWWWCRCVGMIGSDWRRKKEAAWGDDQTRSATQPSPTHPPHRPTPPPPSHAPLHDFCLLLPVGTIQLVAGLAAAAFLGARATGAAVAALGATCLLSRGRLPGGLAPRRGLHPIHADRGGCIGRGCSVAVAARGVDVRSRWRGRDWRGSRPRWRSTWCWAATRPGAAANMLEREIVRGVRHIHTFLQNTHDTPSLSSLSLPRPPARPWRQRTRNIVIFAVPQRGHPVKRRRRGR